LCISRGLRLNSLNVIQNGSIFFTKIRFARCRAPLYFCEKVCEMEWSWFYEPTFHKQSCARIDSILTSIQNRVCEMEWSPVYWAQGHFTNV
jgi:hypothetical protein